MNAERMEGMDPRSRRALNDLQEMILKRYPEAWLDVAPGDDPEGIYLRATVDIDDVEQILDVVRDRLFEIQVDEGLPIYLIPLEPFGRVMGDLRAERSRHAGFGFQRAGRTP